MTQLQKHNADKKLANCNLILMSCLFAISALLGTIGCLITTISYGFYYKYWKPALFIIPTIIFLLVILLSLVLGELVTLDNAYGVGGLLGIIPNLVSFLIFRDRVITLRRRANLS